MIEAQREGEYLIYIGRLARGAQDNPTALRYYALFQGNETPQLVSWSSAKPPQHIAKLTGKDATRFLRERGYRVDKSGDSPQLVKIQPRKKKAKA